MKPRYHLDPDEMDLLPPWSLHEARRSNGPWPAHEPHELALGVWTIVALLGVALGLGIAKYAQAWAQDVFHPAAIWGGLVILQSLTLVVIAANRYQLRATGLPIGSYASRTLGTLSVLLVLTLAWAALSMIWLAGWELPGSRVQ